MTYKNKVLEDIYPVTFLAKSLATMELTGNLTIRLKNLDTTIKTKRCSKETNVDTLKFLHALEEFGAHISARSVSPELKHLKEAKKAKDDIRRVFNQLSTRYIAIFHPGHSKAWLNKPWISTGFEEDGQSFDFIMGELLKYGLPLCYKENTLFSLMFKEILDMAVNIYHSVYNPGSKRITHREIDYPHLDEFKKPITVELLGVTKSKETPNPMVHMTHELIFGGPYI